MKPWYLHSRVLITAMALVFTGAGVAGQAQDAQDTQRQGRNPERETTTRAETQRDATDTREQVDEAVGVVARMKRDPQLTAMLERARGVFIVPDFGEAAVGVGARGGEGVLLVKRGGQWSGPAFYNFGRISAGLEAGAAAGAIAMLLMSDDAVRPFMDQKRNFALDATAGLTVVNYSAQGRAATGEPDVVMWSDTKGLLAGASIGVSGITRDEEENGAYYLQQASPQEIFSGKVRNEHAKVLRDALPRTASR
jgi:SH3 domain-containing YSC84-like protein 1